MMISGCCKTVCLPEIQISAQVVIDHAQLWSLGCSSYYGNRYLIPQSFDGNYVMDYDEISSTEHVCFFVAQNFVPLSGGMLQYSEIDCGGVVTTDGHWTSVSMRMRVGSLDSWAQYIQIIASSPMGDTAIFTTTGAPSIQEGGLLPITWQSNHDSPIAYTGSGGYVHVEVAQ